MLRVSIVLLAVILFCGIYSFYFWAGGTDLTHASLGTLGDFVGGNINPLLTFISTIVLIDSFVTQRKSTKEAKIAEEDAKLVVREQSALATKQSFESSLFNLLNLCLSEYKNTEIRLKSGTYQGSKAFTKYEEVFSSLMQSTHKPDLLNQLEELSGDALFDTLKNFSTLFKLISSNAGSAEKEQYSSLILTLMPTVLIQLLCVAKNHSQWPILNYFEKCEVFHRHSLKLWLVHYA
jgi:uncharacterized membrane protein